MIPTERHIRLLWEKYEVPDRKRNHMELVARVALFLADRLTERNPRIHIKKSLLLAAALLHDIDKNAPNRPGERHPDAAVRTLRKEGMEEVARIVATHSVHAILDLAIAPTSWEEKLLYLADKMVKQDVMTVDKRFALWRCLPNAIRR
jgi:putative nucleotidyltransferase with HDIG domain